MHKYPCIFFLISVLFFGWFTIFCASCSFDPDPTQRLTFWSTVIGGTFSTLGIFGIGQANVQRYCALPTLAQAKRYIYMYSKAGQFCFIRHLFRLVYFCGSFFLVYGS
jgi:fatty-acid desaturase